MSKLGTSDFSAIYLGNTEVVKAYLGQDVVYEKQASADYITDGLVFHLDGADLNGSSWTDRVAGITYTLYSCQSDGSGGVYFKTYGTSYGNGNDKIVVSPLVGTIEIVLSNTNKTTVPFTAGGGSMAFYTNSSTTIISANTSLPAYNYESLQSRTALKTISLNNEIGYCNQQPLTRSSSMSGITGSTVNYSYLARSANSKNKYYSGVIKQIRIYNRQLSAAEMIYNQGIDMEKYGIT